MRRPVTWDGTRIDTVKKQQFRPASASEYDEIRFREALRDLGLFAPVTLVQQLSGAAFIGTVPRIRSG